MGVTAFGQNRLYDEQGAVDLGNAAKRTGAKGVAGGGAAGVPVHAVQPHPAGDFGGDRGKHDGLPSACTRNDPVNTQHSNAAAEPMANQMEVILKVLASSARKPTAAASQRIGEICMVCYLLMLLLYGIPLGEGQELFTGTLHRKQNIDKNGKERMKMGQKNTQKVFRCPEKLIY